MRRITRNERIRDIKPERERGPAVFKLPPRGDAEHDPMFSRPTGVIGAVWIGGLDPLPASPTPATPEPVQELQQYYEQLPEPPPISDETQLKWQSALEQANKVVSVLQAEKDFSGMELVGAVADLLDKNPTAEDIVALYRERMEAKRNG